MEGTRALRVTVDLYIAIVNSLLATPNVRKISTFYRKQWTDNLDSRCVERNAQLAEGLFAFHLCTQHVLAFEDELEI